MRWLVLLFLACLAAPAVAQTDYAGQLQGGDVVLRMRPEGSVVPAHRQGPRVGVAGAGGDAARHPWRFWLAGEPTVSAYRPAYRSPASGNAPGGATAPA